MRRIRAFGCSLTAGHHWRYMFTDDRPERDRTHINDEIELQSYAIPGGSNDMQLIQYANEVHYNNIVKDDIIIWQLTNPRRRIVSVNNLYKSSLILKDAGHLSRDEGYLDVEHVFNPEQRVMGCELTVKSHLRQMPSSNIIESGIDIYQVLWQLNGIKRENTKLLVLFGWDGIFESIDLPRSAAGTTSIEKQNVMKFLKNKDIDYIEDSICEWSIINGYDINDTNHPTDEGYRGFTRKKLMPKLKKLKWLD
jgi:hypothetical protein